MIITLPLKMLHPKIRTQKAEFKYTWYWSEVASELEEILLYDEESKEWFSKIRVRFKDWGFEFLVEELEIEELPTYNDEESYKVNLWLYIYAIFENFDIDNIWELINPNRVKQTWGYSELSNEYIER